MANRKSKAARLRKAQLRQIKASGQKQPETILQIDLVVPTPERLAKGDVELNEEGVFCSKEATFVDVIINRGLYDNLPDKKDIIRALERMLDLFSQTWIGQRCTKHLHELSMIDGAKNPCDPEARNRWNNIMKLLSADTRSHVITVFLNHEGSSERKSWQNHELMDLLPVFRELKNAYYKHDKK